MPRTQGCLTPDRVSRYRCLTDSARPRPHVELLAVRSMPAAALSPAPGEHSPPWFPMRPGNRPVRSSACCTGPIGIPTSTLHIPKQIAAQAGSARSRPWPVRPQARPLVSPHAGGRAKRQKRTPCASPPTVRNTGNTPGEGRPAGLACAGKRSAPAA